MGGSVSLFAGQLELEPSQTSTLSQALLAAPQTAPWLPGVYTHPVAELHESTVHGFWSSQVRAAPI